MTTGDVPHDESVPPSVPPRPAADPPASPSAVPPAVAPPGIAPPIPRPPGILPALPERRAWPWALLFAFFHHVAVALGIAGLPNSQAMSVFLAMAVGAVPFAFVLGLILIARKVSFQGRVLMFAALFSVALVALELAVAAGVCLFAMGNPGFH